MKYFEPKINISVFQTESVLTASGQSVDEYMSEHGVASGNTMSTSMTNLNKVINFNN